MAYLEPNAFSAGLLNRFVKATGAFGTTTLVVPKRVSGGDQEVPVNVAHVDGTDYVVSCRGETQWVRNLRAAGALALRRKKDQTRYAVRELPLDERGPVIAAYREQVGRAVKGYWEALPDDEDHPVFELLPAPGGEG